MSASVVGYVPIFRKVGIRWDKACVAPSAVEILVVIITTFWPRRVCVNGLQPVRNVETSVMMQFHDSHFIGFSFFTTTS